MSKFSGNASRPVRANVTSPIQTTDERLPTYNGGDGWAKTTESELFQLAVTNMVGENTFYESADFRDARFEQLIHSVTKANPDFLRGRDPEAGYIGFVKFLRENMNMRSASLVVAAEYAKAGGPGARQVISNALVRADEPGEMVGYWLSHHGKAMPAAVKRGIADAAKRLYNEYTVLKYDGQSKGIRFADVLELTHPGNKGPWQADLYTHIIDRRHKRDKAIPESLSKIILDDRLQKWPMDLRRSALKQGLPSEAGWTWERLSGWLPGGMDGEAWSAIIPSMGYMALLRNLRNFESAGVPKAQLQAVMAKLTDPDQVSKSRQFPYRFWSAYKANASLTYGAALEEALDLACRNIPALPGKSLVLIDTSSSMTGNVSGKSQIMHYEIGALFAAALTKKCIQVGGQVEVVIFGDTSARLDLFPNESVLRYIDRVRQNIGRVGHGTMTWQSIGEHYSHHDRVVVFTDGQTSDSDHGYYGYGSNRESSYNASTLRNIPKLYTFDTSGYRTAMTPSGTQGRHSFGGFSDATFTIMELLETGQSANWPF